MTTRSETRSLIIGALWMLMAALAVAVLVAVVKVANRQVLPIQALWFQNAVAWVIVAPIVLKGGFSALKTPHPYYQLIRGLSGCIGFFLVFFSLRYIPQVDAVLGTNTAPLWVPILALVWFRDKLRPITWIGIVVGFLGIACILHPGYSTFSPAILMPLATGFLLGVIMISIRVLSKTDGPLLIMFYYFLISTLVALPWTIVQWVTPTGWTWVALIGSGLANIALQLGLVWGLKRGNPAILSPIYYFSVFFSGLIEWLFWGHSPDWLFYVGTALVVLGGVWTIWTNRSGEKAVKT